MQFKKFAKDHLPDNAYKLLRHYWRTICSNLAIISIKLAIAEQGLLKLYRQLSNIVPDITHQYSSFKIDNKYLQLKVRAQHSFQINLANKAIEMTAIERNNKELKIIDIGDSCGTHVQYIKGLWPNKQIRTLSINLDSNAAERIKQKGLEAICGRAEDIKTYSASGDIFLSFEMLEHLMNPFQFLHNLSEGTDCKFLVITVPYLRHSRLGFQRMRNNDKIELNAENTHILELSPDDWRLLFQFSGWRVEYDTIYLQYPRWNLLRMMKFYWSKFDFEGFYGAILVRDLTWSNLYKNWEQVITEKECLRLQ
ncbi:MAG: hypothetical protein JSV30_07315 [Candidatus Omnitrophota bacterium]|nr:MAG: hypothetical protein JSV30_07315 [Candidatus Omnitrophota bacterium]